MSQEHAFYRSKTFNRRKIWLMFLAVFFVLMFLGGRLVYLMVFCSEYYGQKAEDLHERERDIKAARGRIIDATGKILATNKSVCTISVIHRAGEGDCGTAKRTGAHGGGSEKAGGEGQLH